MMSKKCLSVIACTVSMQLYGCLFTNESSNDVVLSDLIDSSGKNLNQVITIPSLHEYEMMDVSSFIMSMNNTERCEKYTEVVDGISISVRDDGWGRSGPSIIDTRGPIAEGEVRKMFVYDYKIPEPISLTKDKSIITTSEQTKEQHMIEQQNKQKVYDYSWRTMSIYCALFGVASYYFRNDSSFAQKVPYICAAGTAFSIYRACQEYK